MSSTSERIKVYLASTHDDLHAHSKAVVHSLRAAAVDVIQFSRVRRRLSGRMTALSRVVSLCDALVVLVGSRLDGQFRDIDFYDGSVSWTATEVTTAVRLGKIVLAFFDESNSLALSDSVFSISGDRPSTELRAFLEAHGHCVHFNSQQDLIAKVLLAIGNLDSMRSPPGAVSLLGGTFTRKTDELPQESAIVGQAFDKTVAMLVLAWRLVIDRRCDPDVLMHLAPSRVQEALANIEGEIGGGCDAWPQRMEAVQKHLTAKQPGLAPNPLWLAWMSTANAARVDELWRALSTPSESNVDESQVRQHKAAPAPRKRKNAPNSEGPPPA